MFISTINIHVIFRCRDYILIDRGEFGTTEICGNQTSMDSVLELQSADFKVFFRTSEETKNTGFEMYAICFEPEERDLEGLLNKFSYFDLERKYTNVEKAGAKNF